MQLVTTSKVGSSPWELCHLKAVLLLLFLTRLLPASKIGSQHVLFIEELLCAWGFHLYHSQGIQWSLWYCHYHFIDEKIGSQKLDDFSQGNNLLDLDMNSINYFKAWTLSLF